MILVLLASGHRFWCAPRHGNELATSKVSINDTGPGPGASVADDSRLGVDQQPTGTIIAMDAYPAAVHRPAAAIHGDQTVTTYYLRRGEIAGGDQLTAFCACISRNRCPASGGPDLVFCPVDRLLHHAQIVGAPRGTFQSERGLPNPHLQLAETGALAAAHRGESLLAVVLGLYWAYDKIVGTIT